MTRRSRLRRPDPEGPTSSGLPNNSAWRIRSCSSGRATRCEPCSSRRTGFNHERIGAMFPDGDSLLSAGTTSAVSDRFVGAEALGSVRPVTRCRTRFRKGSEIGEERPRRAPSRCCGCTESAPSRRAICKAAGSARPNNPRECSASAGANGSPGKRSNSSQTHAAAAGSPRYLRSSASTCSQSAIG